MKCTCLPNYIVMHFGCSWGICEIYGNVVFSKKQQKHIAVINLYAAGG